jgi:hypothetical protein
VVDTVSVMFATFLTHVERNNGLALLTSITADSALTELWWVDVRTYRGPLDKSHPSRIREVGDPATDDRLTTKTARAYRMFTTMTRAMKMD